MAEKAAIFKDKAVKKMLKKIQKKARSFAETDKTYGAFISPIVFRDVIKHFEDEMGPDGKWADWSPSYKAVLAGKIHFRSIKGRTVPVPGKDPSRGKPPKRKLQNTGHLRQSFKPKNFRSDGGQLIWFNNAKTKDGFAYAAHHDEGPSARDGSSRPFMWLSDSALEKIAGKTLSFLLGEEV